MNSQLCRAELASKLRPFLLLLPAVFACSDSPSGPKGPTGLFIKSETTGLDYPTSYALQVRGTATLQIRLRATDSTAVANLPTGNYSVVLDGLASNCGVAEGNTRTVTVVNGALTRVQFSVTCGALSGVVRVSVSTTGVDHDPTGYRLQLSDGFALQLAANGIGTFGSVFGGAGTVSLTGVASNCVVDGPSSQPYSISVGGLTRDTATTSFKVICAATEKFAFVRISSTDPPSVIVAYADGSEAIQVAGGFTPAWSPTGGTLAFSWLDCDYYYYYNGCNKRGLVTLGPTGGFTVLTQDTTDADPAWRPLEGGAIAFSRAGVLYIVNADGNDLRPIIPTTIPGLRFASQPAWSPDAARIAFTCEMDNGWVDICVVAANGTGFVRLTSDEAFDRSAAWSPDGTRIAFVTSDGAGGSQIALMSSDGGAITRMMAGLNPAWSPDGTRLLFEGVAPQRGIFMLTLSSAAVVRLTTQDDHNPAWRP